MGLIEHGNTEWFELFIKKLKKLKKLKKRNEKWDSRITVICDLFHAFKDLKKKERD